MAIKKEINWDMVELYIKAGCTQIEIAESLFIDRDTLRSRVEAKYEMEYSAFSAALRSEGEMLIKAQQYQKAMKGYWPALHWLGKVRCGQKEPEESVYLAPKQDEIELVNENMFLKHELSKMKNADKS